MRCLQLLFMGLYVGVQGSCTLPEPTENKPEETGIAADGGSTSLPPFDAGQAQNQTPDAGTTDLELDDAGQSFPQDAGQTLLYDAGQTLLHDAGQTLLQDAGQTLLHDAGQTLLHDAGQTLLHDAGQTLLYDAGQTLLYDAGQTPSQDAGINNSPTTNPLVAHYPFEDHALDATGNHDGTVIGGVLFSPDAWAGEYSLALMGVDSAIDLGTWDIEGQGLTLAAWLKPSDFSDSDVRIISKATGIAETEHIFMLSERDNQLRLRIRANGSTDTLIAGDLPTGSWIHVAGTYDAASGLMTLYIDGEEKGQSVHLEGGALDQDATVPIWIGANPDGSNYYNGLMDEVRMYSIALTESEIKGLAGL